MRPQIEQTLESVFQRIQQERMQDMPMCNPRLQVQAVGFRQWGEYQLGVMITPWFMNLMLLPRSEEMLVTMEQQQSGSKQTHVFPSGCYEFVNGREAGLGCYQVCSLFSPLLEFEEQTLAVEVAQAALHELMQPVNRDTVSVNAGAAGKPGHQEGGDADASRSTAQYNALDEKQKAVLSRREFLLGRRRAARDMKHGN